MTEKLEEDMPQNMLNYIFHQTREKNNERRKMFSKNSSESFLLISGYIADKQIHPA